MKALKTAIYTLLSTDATLMSKVAAVYAAPPVSPVYPYVVIREVVSVPHYTYKVRIHETYLYDVAVVGVVGQASSYEAILDAKDRINALLELQTVSVTGRSVWRITKDGDNPDTSDLDDNGRLLLQVGATWRVELG